MISLGKKTLARVHTRLMGTVFKIQSFGLEHIPSQQQLLIASNHASHLDYGVLKAALSKKIIAFGALAAADYFFDQRWKRKILLPLTNLVPVMRQGSFSLALKEAETALTNGRSLLIFPEGTRSQTNTLLPFRPGVGYLQRRSELPILPVFIEGTQKILPKGQTVPTGRDVQIHVGAPITNHHCDQIVDGLRTSEAFVRIAEETRMRILALKQQAIAGIG